ncbi:HNH endonuclease [Dasania marina]|uniref:HNH endonuclease n=1 Tax=Dasania marina TaxID=471499 RepID=UPI00037ED25A|nr:HNH endonuclease signature motif containing protein [Dasania marina]
MPDSLHALHERAINSERKLQRITYQKQADLIHLLEECSALFRELAPRKRKLFLSHVVQELHAEQQGVCPLCGNKLTLDQFDVDHIIPWHWGGGNERSNLQITHPSCNRSKGNNIEDLQYLVQYLEDKVMNF